MDPLPEKDYPEHPESQPEIGDLGSKGDPAPEEIPLPPANLTDSAPSQEPAGAGSDPDTLPQGSSESVGEEEIGANPASAATGEAFTLISGCSRKDILWLSALGLTIVGVAIIALCLFFENINTSTKSAVDFPVRGESVVISKIETYWRKVDREEDIGIQLNINFIPAAQVTLKSSDTGSLRFFFENPKGDIVGDSVTRRFSGGVFNDTGKDTANIHSTGGFADLGDYNDYLTEQVHFWNLVIKEGAGAQPEGKDFKEIVRMRISPKRR